MDVDDDARGAGPSGADDAPSTSQQHPDQQLDDNYGTGGDFHDEFEEDMEPASDFQQLKKARRWLRCSACARQLGLARVCATQRQPADDRGPRSLHRLPHGSARPAAPARAPSAAQH
jgi:hypothetical protein